MYLHTELGTLSSNLELEIGTATLKATENVESIIGSQYC